MSTKTQNLNFGSCMLRLGPRPLVVTTRVNGSYFWNPMYSYLTQARPLKFRKGALQMYRREQITSSAKATDSVVILSSSNLAYTSANLPTDPAGP